GAARRMAGREGQGRHGPVPLLQGVQVGMSNECGYRDVSLGISLALLRDTQTAAARLRVRPYRSMGEAGVDCPRRGQRRDETARCAPADRSAASPRAATRVAALRAGALPEVVSEAVAESESGIRPRGRVV